MNTGFIESSCATYWHVEGRFVELEMPENIEPDTMILAVEYGGLRHAVKSREPQFIEIVKEANPWRDIVPGFAKKSQISTL